MWGASEKRRLRFSLNLQRRDRHGTGGAWGSHVAPELGVFWRDVDGVALRSFLWLQVSEPHWLLGPVHQWAVSLTKSPPTPGKVGKRRILVTFLIKMNLFTFVCEMSVLSK